VSVDGKTIPHLSVKSVELHGETGEKRIYLKSIVTNKIFEISFNKRKNKKVLTTPDGNEKTISNIRPGKETILNNKTKTWAHTQTPTDTETTDTDSHRTNRNPTEIDSTTIETVGNCPICECITVKTPNKIICTGCGKWCNKEQWAAYENHTTLHNTGEMKQQTEITDTW